MQVQNRQIYPGLCISLCTMIEKYFCYLHLISLGCYVQRCISILQNGLTGHVPYTTYHTILPGWHKTNTVTLTDSMQQQNHVQNTLNKSVSQILSIMPVIHSIPDTTKCRFSSLKFLILKVYKNSYIT